MKIYTGTGDTGMTSLFCGNRVPKAHDMVQVYGTLDELNSHIGLITAHLGSDLPEKVSELQKIQLILFKMSVVLATKPDDPLMDSLEKVNPEDIRWIEGEIDRIDEKLPHLRQFILPGGHVTAAQAHVARTVCRRAERLVNALIDDYPAFQMHMRYAYALVFLNRLSDYLFVLSRFFNHFYKAPTIQWMSTPGS